MPGLWLPALGNWESHAVGGATEADELTEMIALAISRGKGMKWVMVCRHDWLIGMGKDGEISRYCLRCGVTERR